MKRVDKSFPCPQTLTKYAQDHPDSTWEDMRSDNPNGSQAARECRDRTVQDQRGLCAYCEQKISAKDSLRCRIEHFHPKSDTSETRNWSLDWKNMLAVCDGGSRTSGEQPVVHPLPENLSCDAHKNRMIQTGKLSVACEGHLLNPLEIPAFPNLFALDKGTGYIKPDETSCAAVNIHGNACDTTTELVGRTIEILNLNCERLAEKRRILVVDIDQNKKRLREKGVLPAEMPGKLVSRYFNAKWPEFFTTIRCCLGHTAEAYLQSVNYQG